jgi:hypothetical protein
MYWLFEFEQPYDDDCADGWLPDCRTVQVLGPPRHRVSQKIRQATGSHSSGRRQLEEHGEISELGVLQNSSVGWHAETPDRCP